jgi:2-dehydro-3-deoxyphosphogluconate aldolase / (4S)-4-hydroxy-2-oxoglutarate aldolase
MTPDAVVDKLRERRLVAVLRSPSAGQVVHMARQLARCGVGIVEVTYTSPQPAAAIARLRCEFEQRLTIAAGTITRPEQIDDALDAGADFLVSPGGSGALLTAAQRADTVLVPGVMTPTEILTVQDFGVRVVKLFPGHLHGPQYLRTLRPLFPELEFFPTGGIDPANMRQWLAAGAVAVGVGSSLAPPRRATSMSIDDWRRRVSKHLYALTVRPGTETTS